MLTFYSQLVGCLDHQYNLIHCLYCQSMLAIPQPSPLPPPASLEMASLPLAIHPLPALRGRGIPQIPLNDSIPSIN